MPGMPGIGRKSPYRRSRSIKNAKGADEARISSNAGAAAWAKKASDAAPQMEVAKVEKPIGRNIRVAGSSFMVSRNTRAAPAKIPGRTKGRVTEVNTLKRGRPKLRAASSTLGFTCRKDVRAEPTAVGRKRITYAKMSRLMFWYRNRAKLAPKNTSPQRYRNPRQGKPHIGNPLQ